MALSSSNYFCDSNKISWSSLVSLGMNESTAVLVNTSEIGFVGSSIILDDDSAFYWTEEIASLSSWSLCYGLFRFMYML